MDRSNTVYVDSEVELPLTTEIVNEWAEFVLSEMGVEQRELSLFFCDIQRMTDLNQQYRGKEGATDVLSFSQLEGDGSAIDTTVLGDVIICPEIAAQQAKEYDCTLEQELRRLLVHGILHLLGYDHETNREDADVMQKKEEILIKKLEENS